jgi:cell division protein FtsW
VGFLGGQPSEFVKIALVIYLAGLLARKKDELFNYTKAFLPALLVTGLFVTLIILQSNLGTALIVLCLFFFMMIMAGVRVSHILLTGLGAVPFIILTVVKESYRQQRIFAYLNPWQYPDTI